MKKLCYLLVCYSSFSFSEEMINASSLILKEQKAHINNGKNGYNYVEINNQRDYNRYGNNIGISDNNIKGSREVINVVKIRNVNDRAIRLREIVSRFDSKSKVANHDKNIGIQYNGDASGRTFTNIVKTENTQLGHGFAGGSVNSGVSISSSGLRGTKIYNKNDSSNSKKGGLISAFD